MTTIHITTNTAVAHNARRLVVGILLLLHPPLSLSLPPPPPALLLLLRSAPPPGDTTPLLTSLQQRYHNTQAWMIVKIEVIGDRYLDAAASANPASEIPRMQVEERMEVMKSVGAVALVWVWMTISVGSSEKRIYVAVGEGEKERGATTSVATRAPFTSLHLRTMGGAGGSHREKER
ncbi:hypothetical protein CC1G_14771 [Coprinopsis cinerea okayama7|uniref:Uncharacterized protein n=1 Tax=Coprinopsis cinerea (strain Okayama-7 / 130 / ATCC MYA-4618 / FGSC 9003) TaxID=240176 RepID=D6RNT1_COPC7|nr:hypothetical protein CC1G_14771 [Coprinopsis cinerea okayama7\|eukprot:XP_002910793.1 hypothetical protein CC1G_14771 [Coprinopsis cinerea okayama7\